MDMERMMEWTFRKVLGNDVPIDKLKSIAT